MTNDEFQAELLKFPPAERAEIEANSAWLRDRLTERFGQMPMNADAVKEFLMELLAPVSYPTVIVERGDSPNSLNVLVSSPSVADALSALRRKAQ